MKIATLFSGIGSPEQGAKRVYNNAEVVFACELDKFARQSYEANYNIQREHFHTDVNDLDGKQYKGHVDILIGGSPCQTFSLSGLRKGTEDEKGKLIYQYIRVVDECRPTVIVYENVKGITSIDNGNTIKDFVQALRDIGYHCHYDILNTKDYGVPQSRERLYVVGFLDADTYYRFDFAQKQQLKAKLSDILIDEVNVDKKYYLSVTQVSSIINSTYNTTRNKIQYSDVSSTLTANNYKDPKCVNINGRIRKLTPRECFRLQDFPDSFKFVVSNSQLYKQAGNAMSVNILEMIFNQIEKAKASQVHDGSLF